jgi:hypothetical protein
VRNGRRCDELPDPVLRRIRPHEESLIEGLNSASRLVIGQITGGCKAKKIRLLTTSNTLIWGGGIKVDKSDRIAVLDNTSSNVFSIFTYNQPVNGSLDPVSATPLTGSQSPEGFAFLASGASLYTVDTGSDSLNEYAYPAGGAPEKTIAGFGFPYGVAVTPALVP